MRGLLHLFDFHNNNIARKVFAQTSRDEDLEAPRNSFEIQVPNFQTYPDKKDTPHIFGFEDEWYERSCFPIEASMKKHINEELSKRSNDKQNAPSIVAKLMGVDALPMEAKPVTWLNNMREECRGMKTLEKGGRNRKGRSSVACGAMDLQQMETESVYSERLEKPKRREHPQEEELQKFKREFEAWQALRFKECSRIVGVGSNKKPPLIHTDHRETENLKYRKKHGENDLLDVRRCESERLVPEPKEKSSTRTGSFGREFYLKPDHRAPTSIVVLKPGPRMAFDYEDSLTASSGTMEDGRGSIEDFLEEVKERLKCELQGEVLKRSSTVRGSGIETRFRERPFYDDNKNIAIKAACAGVEDNVGRNNHLPRSESTRSYIGEVWFTETDSPEFISRDTRKLLAERLKNVLKTNKERSERLNALDTERRLKQTGEILNEDDPEDMRTRSFRGGNGYGEDDNIQVGTKDSSPISLIRSLSAPVSGTSFGKLLLEDRHVLTSAQIKRKHEEAERVPSVDPTRRKERFNLRRKVSSFKSTLRGRIFGKKIQSMIESNSFEDEYIKDFVIGSRFTNLYDRNENSTEVPPSPASVCSSTPEEFWRNVDYLTPVSTPDLTIADENGVPQVFRDISSNLRELRRQINELESDLQEDLSIKQEANAPERIDLANPDKTYVRALLVASGLYDGTLDKSMSRYDPVAKPISKSVFQETEENYRKRTKQSSENNKNNNSAETETETETDRKIMFDLLNEALAVVLGPPATKSSCGRKLVSSSLWTPLHGRRLLESAWQIMSEYLYAQTDKPWCSLDGIIAWDLGNSPWAGLMDEEVKALGREVEALITVELVEDVVKNLQLNSLLC